MDDGRVVKVQFSNEIHCTDRVPCNPACVNNQLRHGGPARLCGRAPFKSQSRLEAAPVYGAEQRFPCRVWPTLS
jgi:hypothetical protein